MSEIIISILLWLGALSGGSYTASQLTTIASSNQAAVTSVQNNEILLQKAIQETNPSVVTVLNSEETDQ